MQEEFKTIREFNKRFPSKLYICTRCESLTENPYYCRVCGNQSNNFIFKGYEYKIIETGQTETIFTPIELLKNQESEEQC